MQTTPIWYVTFEVRKRGILPKQRSPREARTFVTEAEAKAFARSKLDEGLTVYAGTINPHTPKRNSNARNRALLLIAGKPVVAMFITEPSVDL